MDGTASAANDVLPQKSINASRSYRAKSNDRGTPPSPPNNSINDKQLQTVDIPITEAGDTHNVNGGDAKTELAEEAVETKWAKLRFPICASVLNYYCMCSTGKYLLTAVRGMASHHAPHLVLSLV